MFGRVNAMKKTVGIVAAAVVAGLIACSTPGAPEIPESASTDTLMDVSVDRDGDVTVVTLVGIEGNFDVSEHSDPWSIAIDLGDTAVGAALAPVAVYDGVVDQVSVSSFVDDFGTTSTRVEIALAGEAVHQVESGNAETRIRILGAGVTDSDMSFDAGETDVWGNAEPVVEAVAVAEDLEIAPPPAATTISRVEVSSLEGGVLVHLVADGVIGQTETFTLEDPDRLVIDLPGIRSSVEKDQIVVDAGQVRKIRIGTHEDKVRVVVDAGPDAAGFQSKLLMPVADGILVTIGESEAVDSALAAATEASELAWRQTQTAGISAAEATTGFAATSAEDFATGSVDDFAVAVDDGWAVARGEEGAEAMAAVEDAVMELSEIDATVDDFEAGATFSKDFEMAAAEPVGGSTPITVHGVEYETDLDKNVERIAVITSGVSQHDWVAPDAETVVVRIMNAVIPAGAAGQIAPRAGGPLSLISAFQQPDMNPSEVRVVIKRQANLVPRLQAVGSNLFIEFDSSDAPAAGLAMAPAVDPTTPQMPTEAAASESGYESLPVIDEEMVADVAVAVPASLAPSVGAGSPASLEPPAAIDVLEEGGLIDGKEYRGRRISLDFKDVDISDVLRLIAEVSDLNIISGDEVKGKVSIRLVDVPWDQALDVILLTKGLGFVRVGNVLRIAPSDVLAQEEEVRLQERRAKEKLEDLVVKLIPVNYADVKEMSSLVKRLLTPRGSVNVDQRTSTLIVKDIPSVIDESTALVKAVDTETPQVMIEAKIVEANLDFARELGSVWSVGAQNYNDPFSTSSGAREKIGGNNFRLGPSPSLGRDLDESNSLSVMNSLTAAPTALFNLSGFLLDEKFNVDVQLQAAENTGNGKVVSSPRVVTLDNTDAEVAQGISIPFQTFENGDAKLEFVDAVLSLKVTPHITADKSIIMKIEVTRDAPDSTVQTATGSPAISKNEAKTETLVRDGQTLVLGGIYTIEKSFRQSRVPYIHRIPIIGSAFKSKEVSDKRKELLIFVTPRIVVQPGMDT